MRKKTIVQCRREINEIFGRSKSFFELYVNHISDEKKDVIKFLSQFNFSNFQDYVDSIEKQYVRVIESIHTAEEEYNLILKEIQKDATLTQSEKDVSRDKYKKEFMKQVDPEVKEFIYYCIEIRKSINLSQVKNIRNN